ncbi:hypothetical protein [Rhizobium herbae]|uniref:DUF1471 domain-containing protein n=1 Tax=Rhizobium herbae TaxID=508661 RepID=A0ABS4ESB8_9HYPH|nr:hypothetical protein [Rhizobium herbae]MBP1860822.1 hypothetical protein [Rhizobium herbae]
MNRIVKLSAIVALTAFPLAGVSLAAGTQENWPQQIDRTVATYKGNNFNIVHSNTLDAGEWVGTTSSSEQATFQKALASNRTLAKELKARSVTLANVIGASQAADGGLTFYVR